MVLLGSADRGPYTPVAVWPDAKLGMDHLTGTAEQALKERRGLLLEGKSLAGPETPPFETHHIAYPIEVSSKIHGVVVLEVERCPRHEVQAIMRQLHWGAAWLEVLIRRSEALQSEKENERLRSVLDLLTSALEHKGFHASAMAYVTRMATTFACDRVSLGFVRRRHVRVEVLSHSAEFGKQTNLIRAIGSAMDEAIDQQVPLVYPLPGGTAPRVTRAQEELSRQHGAGAILTIPMEGRDGHIGALTLERAADKPFDQATLETCETAAALAGPILETKRAEDRWLIQKAADASGVQLKRLLGPGYLVRKAVLILLVGVVTFFSLFKVDYRVTAPTAIEGAVQRVVAAPFDGYVKEAPIRAGDVVDERDVLCCLDDRELRLERIKWVTEREQLVKQHHEAMAEHDRPQIRITRAKIDQAEAQISLLNEQLTRTKVAAPFRGVVMSGDLSQSLGAPVERGDVLFEVAPLDEYRVIAQVDERDITEVAVGQRSG